MKSIFPFLLLCFSVACTTSPGARVRDVVASVGQKELSRQELEAVTPHHLSTPDSIVFVSEYIYHWAMDQLLLKYAEQNINAKQSIERKVEDYRRRLLVDEYLSRKVQEDLDSEVSAEQIQEFYEQYQSKFVLDKPIIQGVFLKLPAQAPQLESVKKWIKNFKFESLEQIEKYSLQNALVYEYFYDKWVDFDEVSNWIPYQIKNQRQFLSHNQYLITTKAGFCYLLYIKDFELSGKFEPVSYAQSKIEQLILQQRKKNFIDQLELEIYNQAIENRDVRFYMSSDSSKHKPEN